MSVGSKISIRPRDCGNQAASLQELHVREWVRRIKRLYRPVDDALFYLAVGRLLAGEPEAIRLEVQSRLYQLIPRPRRGQRAPVCPAWHLE
jgi:hypothetical protein